MPVVLRLLPGDEARLRKIRLAALKQDPDAFGSTYAETAARPPESWVEQLRTLPTWIAREGDEDVGMVRGSTDPDHPDLAWLISMWVRSDARGRGVGTELTREVVDWAAREHRRLALGVKVENHTAKALYRRMGFAPTPDIHSDGCEETWVLDL